MRLSAEKWRGIANLLMDLGEHSRVDIDGLCRCACEGLMGLLDASDVMIVVQRRVAPADSPFGGFRPIYSRDSSPESDRIAITRDWMKQELEHSEDPVLRRVMAGAGEVRTVRHRADIAPARWKSCRGGSSKLIDPASKFGKSVGWRRKTSSAASRRWIHDAGEM